MGSRKGNGLDINAKSKMPMLARSRLREFLVAMIVLIAVLSFSGYGADVDVLIIGSTKDTSDLSFISGNSTAFSPTAVRSELQKILAGAGVGTVNVVLEERYATNGSQACTNLASWFHWPYPAGVESGTRWPNLRGAKGVQWDYVVLIGDPYTIEYMPGLYAHGVAKVAEEVAKGNAETILLMPWPSAGSDSTVAHYKEVVYRTGRSGGFKVAPGGLAWTAAGSPSGTSHPSADGAYIAAASIYSRIWNKSAKESSYVYNDALADTVHTSVTANVGAQQYTGKFNFQSPFKPFEMTDRVVNVGRAGGGSSTEQGFIDGSVAAIENRVLAQYGGERSAHYIFGRDTGYPTGSKDYRNRGYGARAFGYRYQSIESTNNNDVHLANIMRQDIDLADQMISESDTFRIAPRRMLWAGIHQSFPTLEPMPDGTHVHGDANTAVGTYAYTILSNRCPMDPKPDTVTSAWLAQKVGYEMAWHVAHCQARCPGFKVMPSSKDRHTVDNPGGETMTVQFIFPPKKNVTVSIATDDSAIATVSPKTLTFTPSNYSTPQQVTITAATGTSPGGIVNVNFTTSSEDEVFNGPQDSWKYHVNARPTADDQNVTVYNDRATDIFLTGSDADGEKLSFAITQQPTKGTVSITGATATYTPNAGYTGSDSFKFTADDYSAASVPATVNITVEKAQLYDTNLLINGGAERFPFTDHAWVVQGGTWAQELTNVHTGSAAFYPTDTSPAELYQDVDLSNYTDAIDAGLQSFTFEGYLKRVREEMSVTMECRNAADEVLSTKTTDAIPDETWTKEAFTVLAPVNTTKIRVRLNATRTRGTTTNCYFDSMSLVALKPAGNVPPTADNQDVAVDKDSSDNAVTLSASDADGDTLAYSIVSGPTNGSLTGTPPNVKYTPNTGYTGPDSFTFKANDGKADSNTATVSITINAGPNTPPVANDDSVTTDEDTAQAITLTATDADGDGLSYSIVSGPTNGSLSGTAPDVAYTPNAGYTGSDTFTFKANDGTADSNIATVSITVNAGPNTPPVANDQPVTTDEDTAQAITLTATDADGDGLSYSIVSSPTKGSLTGTPPNVTYMPNANYNGADSFTFKANDGAADSDTATVSITVNSVNDQPIAQSNSYTTNEDTDLNVSAPGVLGNDSDVDGDSLTAVLVDNVSNGSLALNSDGSFTYIPGPDFNGNDSFTYVANDGTIDSDTVTVTIEVTAVNDPPTANAQSVTAAAGTPKAIVLTGDDPDGDSLTYSIVDSPTNGSISGTLPNITYTATGGYSGPDSFTFRVYDGAVYSTKATVSITVTNSNSAPLAGNMSVNVGKNKTRVFILDTMDADGDALTCTAVAPPEHGTLTISGTEATYKPDKNYEGADSFTFKANDGKEDSNTATVQLNIAKGKIDYSTLALMSASSDDSGGCNMGGASHAPLGWCLPLLLAGMSILAVNCRRSKLPSRSDRKVCKANRPPQ